MLETIQTYIFQTQLSQKIDLTRLNTKIPLVKEQGKVSCLAQHIQETNSNGPLAFPGGDTDVKHTCEEIKYNVENNCILLIFFYVRDIDFGGSKVTILQDS